MFKAFLQLRDVSEIWRGFTHPWIVLTVVIATLSCVNTSIHHHDDSPRPHRDYARQEEMTVIGFTSYKTSDRSTMMGAERCHQLQEAETQLQSNAMKYHANQSHDMQTALQQLFDIKLERVQLGCDTGMIPMRRSHNKLSSLSNRRQRGLARKHDTSCEEQWLGDGYCDLGCNIPRYRYDKGDCCPSTCYTAERLYPCGYAGYQCVNEAKGVPRWFTRGVQFCHKWEAEHRGSDGDQCDGKKSGKRCSPVGTLTKFFFDNTNSQPGGCLSTWKVATNRGTPLWFLRSVSLCFRYAASGNGMQCNRGRTPNEVCARVNNWMAFYIDQTDYRDGGCLMSWMVKTAPRTRVPPWMRRVRLCLFYYHNEAGSNECGDGHQRQYHCAPFNRWTDYFLDNTHDAPGGCELAWGLLI